MTDLDVSELPAHAFGRRDPLWWGLALMIAIEATMLALVVVSYFYIRSRTDPFPPVHVAHRIAWIALVEVGLWLISCIPTHVSSRAAITGDLTGIRVMLGAATLLAIVAVGLRVYVLHLLPFRWDSHAYGSIVWALLGLQWVHGLTGVGENALYLALAFKGPIEEKHRADIEVSTPLWYFVVAGSVLAWLVVFLEVVLR